MLEKHDIVCGILAGSKWSSDPALPPAERVQKQFDALNHVLDDLDCKERFLDQTLTLLKAFHLLEPPTPQLQSAMTFGSLLMCVRNW